MIKIRLVLDSLVLYRPVEVDIALPYSFVSSPSSYRILYALHPAMQNGNFFFDELGFIEIVKNFNIGIVAPSLGNGYFVDNNFEDLGSFLKDELHPLIGKTFRISSSPSDNYLLGISMGAFGAAHWAFSDPERFSKIALLSGVYDFSVPLDPRVKKSKEQAPLASIFTKKVVPKLFSKGKEAVRSDLEFGLLAANLGKTSVLPKFGLWAGDVDFLSYNQTRSFETMCKSFGIDVTCNVSPGGHNIPYWKSILSDVLSWFNKTQCE